MTSKEAKEEGDGSHNPSPFTLFMGTQSKTNYKKQTYDNAYTGNKKILICATCDGKMKMANGKVFNTGNHPIEFFGPMLYLSDAGFKFDIATSSGKPVVFEMWAYPKKDGAVKEIHDSVKDMLEKPKKISDIKGLDDYAAIFIPGGHGAMLILPKDPALGRLLHQARKIGMPTVSLCHGPAAFLSTDLEDMEFAYKGYETMCFTDAMDAFTPSIGYLPGPMPWKCQASLEEKGMKIINTAEKGDCHVDRELITGDSPKAALNLGKTAAPLILKYVEELEK